MNLEKFLEEKKIKQKNKIKQENNMFYKTIGIFPMTDGRKVEIIKLIQDTNGKVIFNLKK